METTIEPLGLRAQETDIMIVRRLCRAADYAAWFGKT
jgi:hypothetical protein